MRELDGIEEQVPWIGILKLIIIIMLTLFWPSDITLKKKEFTGETINSTLFQINL